MNALKEHVKWLEERCKVHSKALQTHKEAGRGPGDDAAEAFYARTCELAAALSDCVSVKIATEKFMKLKQHEADEAPKYEKAEVEHPSIIGCIGWRVFEIYAPTGHLLGSVLGEHTADRFLEHLNKERL